MYKESSYPDRAAVIGHVESELYHAGQTPTFFNVARVCGLLDGLMMANLITADEVDDFKDRLSRIRIVLQ